MRVRTWVYTQSVRVGARNTLVSSVALALPMHEMPSLGALRMHESRSPFSTLGERMPAPRQEQVHVRAFFNIIALPLPAVPGTNTTRPLPNASLRLMVRMFAAGVLPRALSRAYSLQPRAWLCEFDVRLTMQSAPEL